MNNKVEIRNVTVNDAQAIIDYCNIVGGESDNLSFGGGEFFLNEKFGFEKVGCSPRNVNIDGKYFGIDIMRKQLDVKIK